MWSPTQRDKLPHLAKITAIQAPHTLQTVQIERSVERCAPCAARDLVRLGFGCCYRGLEGTAVLHSLLHFLSALERPGKSATKLWSHVSTNT